MDDLVRIDSKTASTLASVGGDFRRRDRAQNCRHDAGHKRDARDDNEWEVALDHLVLVAGPGKNYNGIKKREDRQGHADEAKD